MGVGPLFYTRFPFFLGGGYVGLGVETLVALPPVAGLARVDYKVQGLGFRVQSLQYCNPQPAPA